jgi:hypothetical protein
VGYRERLDAAEQLIEDLRSWLRINHVASKFSLMSNKEVMFRSNVETIML